MTRQEERDTIKMHIIPLLSQKLLPKHFYSKNGYSESFCSLEAKPLILGEIRGHFIERTLKGLSNALYRGALALMVPELCADL